MDEKLQQGPLFHSAIVDGIANLAIGGELAQKLWITMHFNDDEPPIDRRSIRGEHISSTFLDTNVDDDDSHQVTIIMKSQAQRHSIG